MRGVGGGRGGETLGPREGGGGGGVVGGGGEEGEEEDREMNQPSSLTLLPFMISISIDYALYNIWQAQQ